MSNKPKILQVVDTLYTGGLEMVVKNILLYTKDSFDNSCLVCCDNETDFEAELREKGIKIYHIPTPDKLKRTFYRNLLKFFREHKDFSLVHVHMSFSCGFVAKAAKKNGVKVVISHSHETERDKDRTFIKRIYSKISRRLIHKYSDAYMACSFAAGSFLFGEDCFVRNGIVLNNGVDIKRFAFNPALREKARKELGLGNNYVLGTVGSLFPVKNQIKIVEMLDYNKDFVALIVGEGIERHRLTEHAEQKGTSQRLILPGKKSNVEYYLNAMDLFVFPSVSEGFGIALVEAQANGLPALVSDAIPDEAIVNRNIRKMSLGKSSEKWAETALEMRQLIRETDQSSLYERGMDLGKNMSDLSVFYNRLLLQR